MSKHARVEAIRKLKEQLQLANDPETVLRITNQIAKLTPKPRQARRPRKSQETSAPPSGKRILILNRVTGTAVDQLSPKEKLMNYLVEEYEKRCRARGKTFSDLSRAEKDAMSAELMGSLSAEERAVLEA